MSAETDRKRHMRLEWLRQNKNLWKGLENLRYSERIRCMDTLVARALAEGVYSKTGEVRSVTWSLVKLIDHASRQHD
jgi:hypothetical protein